MRKRNHPFVAEDLDQAIQVIDLFVDKGRILSTKGRSRPEQVIYATEPGTLRIRNPAPIRRQLKSTSEP